MPYNEKSVNTFIIPEIKGIIAITLPGFWFKVWYYKSFGIDSIGIKIAAKDFLINGVEGQRPQAVSLCIDLPTYAIYPQVYGGCGGKRIYVKPLPHEKLAMKGIDIPFRRSKHSSEQTALRILKNFCINYREVLAKNIDRLEYGDIVDYKNLLGI